VTGSRVPQRDSRREIPPSSVRAAEREGGREGRSGGEEIYETHLKPRERCLSNLPLLRNETRTGSV